MKATETRRGSSRAVTLSGAETMLVKRLLRALVEEASADAKKLKQHGYDDLAISCAWSVLVKLER